MLMRTAVPTVIVLGLGISTTAIYVAAGQVGIIGAVYWFKMGSHRWACICHPVFRRDVVPSRPRCRVAMCRPRASPACRHVAHRWLGMCHVHHGFGCCRSCGLRSALLREGSWLDISPCGNVRLSAIMLSRAAS